MRTRSSVPRRRAAVAALVLSALLLVAPASKAGTTTVRGCPGFSFCIYPQNAGWNGNRPSNVYQETYSVPHVWFNLRNQYGVHKVFNNTLCSGVTLNRGYNGADPASAMIWEARSYDWNLTPFNSITLWVDDANGCHDNW